MNGPVNLDRRQVLAGGGALVVSFSLSDAFAQEHAAAGAPKPPGSLATSPYLDAWIRIDADGITAFTGKAELGQGFKTAFQQIAAEELDVPFEAIRWVPADPGRTANEGYTAGSHSMQDSGTAILNAAAQVRALLIVEAARRLDLPAENLRTENGSVVAPDGRRFGYGDLVAGDMLHVQAEVKSNLKDPASYKVMGQPVPRVDIPAKVTGGAAYVQDMRLPGMVHARLVRPPSYGAELTECDTSSIEKLPGVVKVVGTANFWVLARKRNFRRSRRCGRCRPSQNGAKRRDCRTRMTSSTSSPDCHRRIRLSLKSAIRRSQVNEPWKPPIHGPINRTARSAHPARWRSSTTTS